MQKVTIYTTPYCPYCHAAKALLKKKGPRWEEHWTHWKRPRGVINPN